MTMLTGSSPVPLQASHFSSGNSDFIRFIARATTEQRRSFRWFSVLGQAKSRINVGRLG
ncbi:hypothetical protein [Bradyrhizobium sp. Leo121]|uniref:hypothetical protein n=1 Tax=Bradyrhizobium sp. Leo121 TaxID=1571195 RepID=UPI0013EF20A5|nr:hypothetical protein [Bradyrhizobium sp. Leo121]